MVFELDFTGLRFKSYNVKNQTILDVYNLSGGYIGKISFIFSKEEKEMLIQGLKK